MSGDVVMTQWAIYEHPDDAPRHYVVRRWDIVRGLVEPRPHLEPSLADSLTAARAIIPRGLTRVGRSPDDDPTIVEVWL